MLILFGDKIRSQTKPFLYLFQLVAAKDPVHVALLGNNAYVYCIFASWRLFSDEADALTIKKTLMTIALNSTKVYKKIAVRAIRLTGKNALARRPPAHSSTMRVA